MVYSHPATNDAPILLPLQELIEIDTDRALLHGIIEFHANSSSHCFRYNTRHQNHLSEFLRVLRSAWLPLHTMKMPTVFLSRAIQGMTFRCWYALRAELDADETLFGVCCRPPMRPEIKGWFHRTAQTLPAVLLALTNRRLIAISTGAGQTDDLYEIVVRYAATDNLKAATISCSANGFMFSLALKNSRDWKFLFENDQRASAVCLLDLLKCVEPTLREVATDSPRPENLIGDVSSHVH
jgi:hypothetical protein